MCGMDEFYKNEIIHQRTRVRFENINKHGEITVDIHFSIDDVFETLRWCWENEPDSIFDMDFYGRLRKWHDLYGLRCNLYVFYTKNGNFGLGDLQEKYKDELNAADWMVLSYHGVYSEVSYEVINTSLFASEWEKTLRIFPTQDKPHMSRFHYWNMPHYFSKKLFTNGVTGLLTPDVPGRKAYWLNDDEIRKICKEKEICVEDVIFWETDLRWDSLTYEKMLAEYSILLERKPKRIVLFGHEGSFSKQKDMLGNFMEQIKNATWLL